MGRRNPGRRPGEKKLAGGIHHIKGFWSECNDFYVFVNVLRHIHFSENTKLQDIQELAEQMWEVL